MPNRNLQEQLRLLYELQDIDTEILALRRKLKSVPLNIKKLEEGFQTQRQKLQAKQEELADAEKQQRSKTAEVEVQQEQRGKYMAHLREVKTNKEYQALDREISFLDDKKAEIEDEILSVMLRIDQLNEDLDQQKKDLEAEKTENNKQKAQYEQEAESLKAQIAVWQNKRKGFSHKIDQVVMGQYQEWFKRHHTGIVSLVADHVCGSCHIRIPPQTLKEARKYVQFVRCGSCKCILYILPPPPADTSSEDDFSD
jgi:hypothetical protein